MNGKAVDGVCMCVVERTHVAGMFGSFSHNFGYICFCLAVWLLRIAGVVVVVVCCIQRQDLVYI